MFLKNYWVETALPDGTKWGGNINTKAENEKDFPEIIKGTFSVKQEEVGCLGHFKLDTPIRHDEDYIVAFILEPATNNKTWEKQEFKIEDCLVPSKSSILKC